MIITCTACERKFEVPDNAIPAVGRTVQCSVCSNKWKQFPISKPKAGSVSKPKAESVKTKQTSVRKKITKPKGIVPYSKEYMKQKWGGTVKDYAVKEGLTKEKRSTIKKVSKISKGVPAPSFGFFNYIITLFVLSTFLIGILNFERSRLSRKFPFLEPYIESFFETLNNFKIFILDFYR